MRAVRIALVAAILAVPCARADRVAMPDEIQLAGKKVEIREIRERDILVRVAYGDITIPRERVTEMTVDFAERLKRLKAKGKDIPRELFLLARVCVQLDMAKEAMTAYREAMGRGGIPDDILIPMARDLEAQEAWRAAHKCYTDYLKVHPDNAEIKARAAAAAAKAAEALPDIHSSAKEPGAIELAVTPATTQPVAERPAKKPVEEPGEEPVEEPAKEPVEEPAKKPVEEPAEEPGEKPAVPGIQEGLEADPGWSSEAWGSTVQITVGAPGGDGKDKMLQVLLAGAEKDKANVMLEDDFDLSRAKAMTFDVYNCAKKHLNVATAFINRPGWKFYESTPATILPTGVDKPRKVSIDLTTTRFKSADTRWRYRTALENRDKVVKIYFLIYTNITNEWVFINNIRFVPADGVAEADMKVRKPPKPKVRLPFVAPRPKPPARPKPADKPAKKPAEEPAAKPAEPVKPPAKPADPPKPPEKPVAPKPPAEPKPAPKPAPAPLVEEEED